MAGPIGEERRGEERFEFAAAEVLLDGKVVGRLRNFSEVGLGIVSRERLERDAVLDFEVRMDGESKAYRVSGRVAYCIGREDDLCIAGFALTSKQRGFVPALKSKRYRIVQGEDPEPPAPEKALLKKGRPPARRARAAAGTRARKTTLKTGRARAAKRSAAPIVAGVGVVVVLCVGAGVLFAARSREDEEPLPRRAERRAARETPRAGSPREAPPAEERADEPVELPRVADLAPEEREKARRELVRIAREHPRLARECRRRIAALDRARRAGFRDEAQNVLDETARLVRAREFDGAIGLCDSYLERVPDSPFAEDFRRARSQIESLARTAGPTAARAPELALAPEATFVEEEEPKGPSPEERKFAAASKGADELERKFELDAAERAYGELAGGLTEAPLKRRALGRAEDVALIRSLLRKVAESVADEPIVVPRLGMRRGESLRITEADERGFSGESVSRVATEARMTVRRRWTNIRAGEVFEVFCRTRLDAEGWFALGVFCNDFGVEKRMPECFSRAVETDAGLAGKVSEYAARLGLAVGLEGEVGGLEETIAAALLRKAVWYEGAGRRPNAIQCLTAITKGYARSRVAGEAHRLLSGGLVRMSAADEGARSAREKLLSSPRRRAASVAPNKVLDAAGKALESGLEHYGKAMPGMPDAERARALAQADFALALALYERAGRFRAMNAGAKALQERASFLLYACMKMQTLSVRQP